MGSFSVGERNKMLDAITGRATYTAPAAFYVQMHIGAPGAAGTSNVAASTTRTVTTFGSAAAAGAIANTADVILAVTAGETITDVTFWSASSGGTFLGQDDLNSSAVVVNGDEIKLATGQLQLSLT